MSYLGIPPFGRTSRTVTEVAAISGQTTFYPTGGYTVGYIDVVLNGIQLNTTDYTATDGLAVVLLSPAAINDELHFTSYTVNFVEVDPSGLAVVALSGTFADLTAKPTTISGYGITDAQPLDADLTAIAAISGTTGLLKKTATNTWTLDTSAYLTAINSGQVTTALGFTPYNSTNPSGYISNNQTITFTGDASGSGTTSVALTLANSGVAAGTYGSTTNIPQIAVDAKGRITGVTNVAVSIPSGSITFTGDVTGTGTTGSSTALTLANSGVVSGTYTKTTVDAKGRVTSGTTLSASDIPGLDASKITGGTIDAARLPSYVDDVLEYTNLASFPASGETGKIYVALDTNKTYRWSGSAYVYITSGAVDSVAGRTGVVTLTSADVGLGSVENKSSATIRSEISSANVTTALGFTPYNSTNPSSYITTSALSGYLTSATAASTYQPIGSYLTGITSSQVTTALGFTPYNSSNPSGYISGITSSNVTTALGFTPYNATNPSGYITSSSLSSYLPLTGGTMSGTLSFQQPVGLNFANGQYIKDNSSGGLAIYSTYQINLNADTFTTATNSLRAPLFYDSNNTSYYIDPANSTISAVFAGPIVSAGGLQTATSGYNTPYNIFTLSNTYNSGSSFYGIKYVEGNPDTIQFIGGGVVGLSVGMDIGHTTALSSLRAPVFYDSDNTSYYLDAANSASAGALSLNGGITFGIANPYLTASSYFIAPGGAFFNSGTVYIQSPLQARGGINNDSAAALVLTGGTGGYTEINGSTRSPIYYDISNTGYYIDPASNSVLNSLATYGNIENYQAIGAADDVRTGIVAYDTTAMGTNIGGQIVLGYKYTASGSYTQGAIIKMYKLNGTDGDYSSGLKFQVRNTGEALATRVWIEPSGGLISDELMQSPIYYDYNNSGYYIDPASTSRFVNTIIGGHGGTAYDTASNGRLYIGTNVDNAYSIYTHLESYGGNYTKLTLDWHTGIKIGAYKSYGGTRFYNNSISSSGQQVFSVGEGDDNVRVSYSLYTPITYDSNNTSYYIDPASTSNLSTTYINTHLYTSYSANNPTIRISGAGSAGLLLQDNTSAYMLQLYGYGNQYGFLASAWGSWDIRKVNAGALYLNNQSTYYYDTTEAYLNRVYGVTDIRSPVYYDNNDSNYYLDPNSVSNLNVLQLTGALEQGNNYAHPNIEWAQSGDAYGEVIFYLPGTTGNYGMVHMVFDIYEYNSPRTATVIVGGHNWGTSWYNTACNVIGYTDKQVRVGIKDGRFVVVFGTTGSYWSYGQVRLRKIQNGSYYNNAMDLAGNWSAAITTSESFSYISGDLRGLRTPSSLEVDGVIYGYTDVRSPIYYDYNDTGYYIDPASTSNSALRMRGGALFGPNTTWGAYLAVGTNGDTNTAYASVATTNGNLHLDAAASCNTYLNYYAGSNVYFGNGASGGIYAQVANDGSFRSPIFYDYQNTAYYMDPNTTGTSINVAGAIIAGGNITAFSDERLKTNWQTPIADFVEKLAGVLSGTFTRTDTGQRQAGVGAQSLQPLLPEAVIGTSNLSVAYGNAAMVSAVELAKRVVKQDQKIAELTQLVQKLLDKE